MKISRLVLETPGGTERPPGTKEQGKNRFDRA